MLPRGIKVGYGFLALYAGLIVFLLANVVVFFTYDYIPANTPLDPVMYLGLIAMFLGPTWFWVVRPVYYSVVKEEMSESAE